jgi:hypothetical protein
VPVAGCRLGGQADVGPDTDTGTDTIS